MKRQQFLDGPTMIRDARGHRRGGRTTGMGQTRMWRAEIIDCSYQIPAMLQCHCAARQRTSSTGQGGQPLTKCRIEPLDVRRVDHARALGPTSERLHACGGAIYDAAFDVHDAPLGIAVHDLRDVDMTPRPQPGTPMGAWPGRVAEGLAN